MRRILAPVLACMLLFAGTVILYQDLKIDALEAQLEDAKQVQQEQDLKLDSAQNQVYDRNMLAKSELLHAKETLQKLKAKISKSQKN
jgi:hypothetical protein